VGKLFMLTVLLCSMLFKQWLKQSTTKQNKPIEDQLTVQHVTIPVSIYIEQRKNYRSSFTKSGVNIRIPTRSSKEQKRKQIKACKQWAAELLAKKPNLLQQYKRVVYKNGHIISTFEKDFTIKVSYQKRKTIGSKVYQSTIELILPTDKQVGVIKPKHISKALANHYREFLENRLRYWNELVPVQHKTLRLKYNSSNWGSCSTKKNINLSTRLLLCPLEIIDYIMVHELVHLIQPNHSKTFWAEVEKIMPDYKQKEEWLKTKGAHVDF